MPDPTPTTAETGTLDAALLRVRRLSDKGRLRDAMLTAKAAGATVQQLADASGLDRTTVYRRLGQAPDA